MIRSLPWEIFWNCFDTWFDNYWRYILQKIHYNIENSFIPSLKCGIRNDYNLTLIMVVGLGVTISFSHWSVGLGVIPTLMISRGMKLLFPLPHSQQISSEIHHAQFLDNFKPTIVKWKSKIFQESHVNVGHCDTFLHHYTPWAGAECE